MCTHFMKFVTVYTLNTHFLILKAPITIKFLCFHRLQKCFDAFSTNSVDPDQTAPSGSTPFASILTFLDTVFFFAGI